MFSLWKIVGAKGAGFFFWPPKGKIFFWFTVCVYTQNTQIFWRIQKWVKNTRKKFDPRLDLWVGPWLMGA